MDANRRLAELLKIPWHEVNTRARSAKCSCGLRFNTGYDLTIHGERNYKDFAADPRLVLREMMRFLSKDDFEDWLCEVNKDDVFRQIDVGLILDTTGLLRDRAIDWLERGE